MAKGPDAFRTISEAADEVGVAPHVLRFWETKFSFLKPMKRAGGRRFYRPRDVLLLTRIQHLLHGEGMSIAQVQKLHREGALKAAGATDGAQAPAPRDLGLRARARLNAVLEDLLAAKATLDLLLRPR